MSAIGGIADFDQPLLSGPNFMSTRPRPTQATGRMQFMTCAARPRQLWIEFLNLSSRPAAFSAKLKIITQYQLVILGLNENSKIRL